MTLTLDHLAIVAPSLEQGAAHVRQELGIDMPFGGKHPEMGTHNLLLRLGDGVFLEVIAVDPGAAVPARSRWFGLDDEQAIRAAWDDGRKLRGWVARTDDLDSVLGRFGDVIGRKTAVSRGDRRWFFAVLPDGTLPAGGALPPVIDWGPRGCPAPEMPDLGARLVSFEVEHPDPGRLTGLYEELGIIDPPQVRKGAQVRLRAMIDTPGGIRELC
jgi:hypothetical protein